MKKAFAWGLATVAVLGIAFLGLVWLQGHEFDRAVRGDHVVIAGKYYPVHINVQARSFWGRNFLVTSVPGSLGMTLSGRIRFGLQPTVAVEWIPDGNMPQLRTFVSAFHPRAAADLSIRLQPEVVKLLADAGSLSDQSAKVSFAGLLGKVEIFDSFIQWKASIGELTLHASDTSHPLMVGKTAIQGDFHWGDQPQMDISSITDASQIPQIGTIAKQTSRYRIERSNGQWQQSIQFDGEKLELPAYGITQADFRYDAKITWPQSVNPLSFIPAVLWGNLACPWSAYCNDHGVDSARLNQDMDALLLDARQGHVAAQVKNLVFSSPDSEIEVQAQAQMHPQQDGTVRIAVASVDIKKASASWLRQYVSTCAVEKTCTKTAEDGYKVLLVLSLSNGRYVLTANNQSVFAW